MFVGIFQKRIPAGGVKFPFAPWLVPTLSLGGGRGGRAAQREVAPSPFVVKGVV